MTLLFSEPGKQSFDMEKEQKKEKYAEFDQPPFSAQQQHPWLVICHGNFLKKQTFFSVSENRYYMRDIAELKERIISAYADKWLVLESIYSNDCYLWNFSSKDKIQLPPLPDECEILKCLLSAPPDDPECQVLFLIKETADQDEDKQNVNRRTFYFCKPGYNEEFHKQDANSIIGESRYGTWTVFKKRFYVLIGKIRILICLDPDNDSGRITATRMADEEPDLSRSYLDTVRLQHYIIQSSSNDDDDTLLYVHLIYSGKKHGMPYHFLVFRFDFAKKRWMEVESIGEIAIFLSFPLIRGTTCSTRGTNLKGESIYFTDGRYLYIYNLITHSISLSLPCPHVSKIYPHMHWLTLN